MSSKGLFVTFEGGEGAGKTTLIEALFLHLVSLGHHVIKTREPGGTKLGEEIRSLLLDQGKGQVAPRAELCLFLASRAQHVFEVIAPALEAGKIVLCDRFNDSSVAYQGIARDLGKKEVLDVCLFSTGGLKPHLTFYLDIDPALGLQRVEKSRTRDRIEAEGFSFHTKIRNAYVTIQKEDPQRVQLIDASQSKEKIFNEAVLAISPLLKRVL